MAIEGLHIIMNIRGIWWGDDGIADVLLKLMLLLVITFPISVWISWDFMSLNLIPNQCRKRTRKVDYNYGKA